MDVRRALEAGMWAGVLGGVPSTLHAIATGRDPLEATLAAGSLLLPLETRRWRLLAAAVPVHLGVSLAWALVLERARVRGAARGAAAGLGIAVVGLGAGRALSPRFRAPPLLAQVADHVAYGAIAGAVLERH
jgi:hypothetical protein